MAEEQLKQVLGAEELLASMAIRLALNKITTLPKADIFILDEPAVGLDADNLDGFIKMLEMLKGCFKTILLISHIDTLKDCVDDQIIINKVDRLC